MTNPGLKNPDSSLASLADGEMLEYFLALTRHRRLSGYLLLVIPADEVVHEACIKPVDMNVINCQ